MSIAFGFLLMVLNAMLFLRIFRHELLGRSVLITPTVLFCVIEMAMVWPAPFSCFVEGIAKDGYPAFVAAVSFLAFLFGVKASRHLARARPDAARLFRARAFEDWREAGPVPSCIILATLLFAAGFFLYRGWPPQVSLFATAVLKGQPFQFLIAEMSAHRFELTKSHLFGGEYRGQGAIRAFLSVGWSFLLVMMVVRQAAARSVKYRSHARRAALLLAFACMLFIAGDGTRAPFLFVLIQVLASFSLLCPLRRVSVAYAIATGFALLLILSLTSHKSAAWSQESAPLRAGIEAILERIVTGNGNNNVHIIELTRSGRLEFMNGAVHLRGFLNALPGTRMNEQAFSNMLAETVLGKTTSSYSTPTFLGTLYFDFGLAGCLIGYAIVGASLQWIERWLFSGGKRMNSLPFRLSLAVSMGLVSLYGVAALPPRIFLLSACHLIACSFLGHAARSRMSGAPNRPLLDRARPAPEAGGPRKSAIEDVAEAAAALHAARRIQP